MLDNQSSSTQLIQWAHSTKPVINNVGMYSPREKNISSRKRVWLGWHAQQDELAINLEQWQQLSNVMLRTDSVYNAVKATHCRLQTAT